jgi:hypothetical protein
MVLPLCLSPASPSLFYFQKLLGRPCDIIINPAEFDIDVASARLREQHVSSLLVACRLPRFSGNSWRCNEAALPVIKRAVSAIVGE